MSYKTSIILQPDQTTNQLESVVAWMNSETKTHYTKETIVNQPNILILNQEKESIKIATVRETKEKLSFSTYQKGKTQFVILLYADLTTIPAQNALLKSIEEPPLDTQIILVTYTPEKLLETIRSRCKLQILINNNKNSQSENTLQAGELYTQITCATLSEKIEIASQYKERGEALELCTALLFFLHQQLQEKISTQKIKSTTHNIRLLLIAIDQLEHNTNVSLTLENCFFELL